MTNLSVVTYLYEDPNPCKVLFDQYNVGHVNAWARMMLDTGFPDGVDLVLVTDYPEVLLRQHGLLEQVRVLQDPAPQHIKDLGRCYRRLAIWDPELWPAQAFNSRILMIDLDVVVMKSLMPLVDKFKEKPVVFWEDQASKTGQFKYNGSMLLMDWGAEPFVYQAFAASPEANIKACQHRALIGSDQAWYGYLFTDTPVITYEDDGVASYKFNVVREGALSKHVRIVFFHGKPKPWDLLQEPTWIDIHYKSVPSALQVAGGSMQLLQKKLASLADTDEEDPQLDFLD